MVRMAANTVRKFFLGSNGVWTASIVAVVCFLAGIAVTAHVGQLVRNELISQHKRDAVGSLSEARARLEGEISRTVAHGLAVRAFVAELKDTPFELEDYRRISMEVIEDNTSIRSVGIAPNNILQAVFPLEPNRAALGLNYRMNTAQWPAIREAMLSREMVIAGPLELVQGGKALLIRIPVFPADAPGQPMKERPYWGVITLVLDEAGVMSSAGITDMMDDLRIALVDRNAVSEEKAHIYGSLGLEKTDHVSLPLHLPGGLNWELQGYPEMGWSEAGNNVWTTQLIGSLISLVFGAMAFLLISEVYKVRSMALHDPLTGLANRRLLEDRMHQLAVMCERTGTGFEIFYVDLDAFKPVNDNYGHSVGDQLLIEIGLRLQRQTRQTDTVARVGGDEFIVLTPGNMRRPERQIFLTRMEDKVNQVFECAGAVIEVQASIGSASFPGDASTVDDLLRVADGRMYAQKAKAKQKPGNLSGVELPKTGGMAG
ncbi:diguanylate cyclase [Roseibium denhamense]|uniref:Diguanylate cyclase (GGDEF) domain-containing protein n=1 Tax=Roseibium denhamense TaxID=76305 RepID=A0ABY1PQL8_9HYPH|nr:diguanylate cyclase [Roseibium denhamense]SMP36776.1 diguanylate cyclase (GGDEF) domain-containing protein [Roseibium denhamense]